MDVGSLFFFALSIAAGLGLSFWADRAQSDRSAIVGLYLLFGLPGFLLTIWGIALLTFLESNWYVYLFIGLALTLPLLKPVRRLVARISPLDPASAVDMVGLCLVLTAAALFAVLLVNIGDSPEEELEVGAVSRLDLAAQAIWEVGLAYVSVGWLVRRNIGEATRRLGMSVPGWKTILIAVGFVVLAYVGGAVGSVLTYIFQPDLSAEITEVTEDLTADVQDPVGAVMLGASAGIGEEALFRGAIQPRIGIPLTSLLFALVHSQYGFSFVIVGLFLVGAILGLERKYFGTTAAMITHAIFNVIAVLAQ